MRIVIAGKPGSGKSTVAKLLAAKLGYKHYSIGDLMRKMAKERGVSFQELTKEAETNKEIDKELDDRTKSLSKEDNFVMDSRLAWFFIPNSFKIFLDAGKEIRAKRILKEKRNDENAKNVEEMIRKMEDREKSEKKRYKQYYNIDLDDMKNFDVVIDTSSILPEEILDIILGKIRV